MIDKIAPGEERGCLDMSISNLLTIIDDYILDNLNTLTCVQLANLYLEFIDSLKVNNLNTNNLTGLTEIILSRAFYCYNKIAIESGYIRITSNISLAGRQPDLVVLINDQPVASIEVKSNYGNIQQDYDRHKQVLKQYPGINFLTVAFEVKQRNNIKRITSLMEESTFYKVLVLNQSEEIFKNELQKYGLIF
ncbi:hypothetical protein [Paenibacillus massiliensis]|uniref:hypothetical protein n=1 Tax=Paenibacillus massiliensis TaxID=225917 RepID=UPI0012DCD213|nr:hypothetical protein [Paenibacillus massiliensis]